MGGFIERFSDPNQSPPRLEVVYAELNGLLLRSPDLAHFVPELARLTASVVPGTRCVISLRRLRLAPPATTPHAREADARPGRIAPQTVHGEVSMPLVVQGVDVGTIRVFPGDHRGFTQSEVDRLHAFVQQAAIALTLLLRQSAHTVLDAELQEALVTRAVIDQAIGVLMHARKITSRQAFEILRHASQTTNRKVSSIAADLILAMTGHPPEPPRPLSQRETSFPPDPTGT